MLQNLREKVINISSCMNYLSISCSLGGVGGRASLYLPLQSTWPPAYLFNHFLNPTTRASDFVGTKQAFCQLVGPASIIFRSYRKSSRVRCQDSNIIKCYWVYRIVIDDHAYKEHQSWLNSVSSLETWLKTSALVNPSQREYCNSVVEKCSDRFQTHQLKAFIRLTRHLRVEKVRSEVSMQSPENDHKELLLCSTR